MKLSADKIVQYVSLLGSAAALMASYHFSRVSVAAASTKVTLSTDQMIASHSTNVTVLGGIVAIATVAIGVAALYGYGELRAATFRKTEDDLVRIIRSLRDSGQLSAGQASLILQGVVPDRFIGQSHAAQKPDSVQHASQETERKPQSGDRIAKDYPEGN